MRSLQEKFERFCENGTEKEELAHILHTLKGSAAMVGLQEVSALAHEMEDGLENLAHRSQRKVNQFGLKLGRLSEMLFPERDQEHEVDNLEKSGDAKVPSSPRRKRVKHAYELLAGIGRLRTLFESQIANSSSESWRWRSEADRELKLLSRSALNTVFCPIDELLAGLHELVESLLTAEGKKGRFETTILQQYVLRDMVPDLRASFIHLISNSIVHGLETPEERMEQGKDVEGIVSLRVGRHHDKLQIVLEDDGRGVDLSRLKEKVTQWHTQTDWEQLTKVEQLNLLFRSGTTLAEQLTVRAGRGVGLTAVRDAAKRLGGSVGFVNSNESSTAIKMEVPVPLFLAHCLEVVSCSMLFLVASYSVRSVENKSESGLNACHSLPRLLGLTEGQPGRGEAQVLLGSESACEVCEILGVSSSLVYPVPEVDNLHPAIVGLADHHTRSGLVYVVDLAQVGSAVSPGSAGNKVAETKARRVLVIDDSATTRSILLDVLARAGYSVEEAVDGEEGLRMLQSDKYDIVVSDYEMPHLNGLELLEAVRKEESELTNLVFLLFTSRDQDETFEKALLLGADKCLSKAYFDETKFLQTLRRLAP